MAIRTILQGIYEITYSSNNEIEKFLESTYDIISDIEFILSDYKDFKNLILGK